MSEKIIIVGSPKNCPFRDNNGYTRCDARRDETEDCGFGKTNDFPIWCPFRKGDVIVSMAGAKASKPQLYSANIKSNDPIISERRATGWYCQVAGKHCLILDDAERVLTCYDPDGAICGWIEIDPDTLERVE